LKVDPFYKTRPNPEPAYQQGASFVFQSALVHKAQDSAVEWRRRDCCLSGAGEGRSSGGFGGEVSGRGFAASVFDIWAMRDDGPPKMSSAKNDFASRNEVI
jgi:hypothetical protein